MKWSFFVLLLSIGLYTVTSCTSDSAMSEKDFVGKWEVIDAQRDGRPTELVNGATFVFNKKGSMKTDFPAVTREGTYVIEGEVLRHHGNSETIYTIHNLTKDSMRLAVELQGLNFVLDLVKQKTK